MYILMIVSGIMMGLCFTFNKLDLIGWIALVPFFYVLLHKDFNNKKVFKLGLAYGTTFYLVLLHWILVLHPLDWIGFSNIESIITLVVGWILLSLLFGSIIGLVPLIFKKVKNNNNNYVNIISIAFIWIIIEGLQGIGPLGFTWGRISISQGDMTWLIQGASLFGSLFVSFLMVFINGVIAKIYIDFVNNRIKDFKIGIVILVSVFFINFTYGGIRFNRDTDGKEVNVSIIQGNIEFDKKWIDNKYDILDKYKYLSNEAIESWRSKGENVDLLVWPETAIPISLNREKGILKDYYELAEANDLVFVVGGFYTDNSKDYNSMYVIEDNKYDSPLYSKRKLVPFGEYMPFSKIIAAIMPSLNKMMIEGALQPGTDTNVTKTSLGAIGGLICYESIFASLASESVNDGAELLIIVTNDSWFKGSAALEQHKKQAVFRAIENNKYIVRAGNTGMSVVIEPNGNIKAKVPVMNEEYLNAKVAFNSNNTLYSVVGDVIVVIALLYLIVVRRKYN